MPTSIDSKGRQRWRLVCQLTKLTDKVMVALAFIWVGLMVREFTGEPSRPLLWMGYAIWVLFGLDFLIKFLLAPHKGMYLRRNWITVISLVLPAFRLLRIFQAARLLRTVSLLRLLTSVNRGMQAVARAMGKRGLGYVIATSVIVHFSGAAGMYRFENPGELASQGFSAVVAQGGGLESYGDAVWWTAMLMTTIGSQYWPVTAGGRILCWLLSLYSLAVFGYITAAVASYFVGRDRDASAK